MDPNLHASEIDFKESTETRPALLVGGPFDGHVDSIQANVYELVLTLCHDGEIRQHRYQFSERRLRGPEGLQAEWTIFSWLPTDW